MPDEENPFLHWNLEQLQSYRQACLELYKRDKALLLKTLEWKESEPSSTTAEAWLRHLRMYAMPFTLRTIDKIDAAIAAKVKPNDPRPPHTNPFA